MTASSSPSADIDGVPSGTRGVILDRQEI